MVYIERSLFFSVVFILAFQQVIGPPEQWSSWSPTPLSSHHAEWSSWQPGQWTPWQLWSGWSGCSSSCGIGYQMRTRSRTCEGNPADCLGSAEGIMTKSCLAANCSACDSGPCQNNATCIDRDDGSFACLCSPSFTGFFCEESICPAGQEYNSCGSVCPSTCEQQPDDCGGECIEGCFCIEGTVLHDGTCIPPEECPCVLDGGNVIINNGGIAFKFTETECYRCTCIERNLTCINRSPCRPMCTVAGDPHYETFDGRKYNFMGNCSYILVKDIYPGHFIISAENVGCRRRRTCLHQVYIRILQSNTLVTMNRDLEVFVDGANVTLPHSIAQVVQVDRVSPKKIEVSFNTGVTVIWSGRRLKIKNSYFLPTHGLCGSFDLDPYNDFQTRDGPIVTDVNTFADSWRDGGCGADT